ncbi:(4Fe-4S)-binding protein [Kitasatospora mediocidica]|uniref:(4Fe-4S)-binding protein n=1 Tax=Kitasatospora mediocidica TaxID=58352 RepID=UPI0018DB6F3C|nr:(4Fe-4S)-binding protein [Kitasatospora mediocidica]
MTEPEPPKVPAVKSYRAEGVTVTFDPGLCRHAAECVRGLPAVFDTTRRPWIEPGAAPPEQVAEVVRRCPTGALGYRLADGSGEPPARPTEVLRTADGRLLLRGDLRITEGGAGARQATRAMLCGCGSSASPPYCDRSGACGG